MRMKRRLAHTARSLTHTLLVVDLSGPLGFDPTKDINYVSDSKNVESKGARVRFGCNMQDSSQRWLS